MATEKEVLRVKAHAGVGACVRFSPNGSILAPVFGGNLGFANARCGHRALALEEIARLEGEARTGKYVSHYAFAKIYTGLGDKDRAFAELDSAVVERVWPLFTLKADPLFDSLREDPRFGLLLAKVGLSPGSGPRGSGPDA